MDREQLYYKIQCIVECPDDAVEVLAPEKMLPWILSFGTKVEVMSPNALRDLMAEETCKIVSQYR